MGHLAGPGTGQEARSSAPFGERAGEEMQRAWAYSLLGALLADSPESDLLKRVQEMGDVQPDEQGRTPVTALAAAWQALKAAAGEAETPALDDEFHDLFIGIGRGELMPYASWYLTGFIMEQPLAELRQDLKALGFERRPEVFEPEDHAAALCEIMSMLICGGQETGFDRQRTFFDRHMAWMMQMFIDMQKAQSACFYRAVGRFGEQFMAFEKEYLAMTV